MTFRLDERLTEEEIARWSQQIGRLPEESIKVLKERFNGRHSREFYDGLLSGYIKLLAVINLNSPVANSTVGSRS